MTVERQMPSYTCHKKVRAAEIISVGHQTISSAPGEIVRPVTLAGNITINLSNEMFTRYMPESGDFLVVYEDGYKSFSPRKAFLDGYTEDGESFADIKRGLKIGRPPLSDLAATNTGDGVALTSAEHPGDPFKGQE
jgi:hypothetical protein